MASGHMNRVKRPDTWLHRPMLQNVKKVLANPVSLLGFYRWPQASKVLQLAHRLTRFLRRRQATTRFYDARSR